MANAASSPEAAAPHPFLLALGDSLTAGHGLAPGQSFAARLQVRLREQHPHALVHNAGVSGNTAGDALQRLPRVLAALRHRPDLAIVELGANDLLRGIPPARTRATLGLIIEELGRCAIPVLLATLEPPAPLAGFAQAYGEIYAQLAATHGVRTHPFFPPGILGHRDYVLADRIHPNAAGIDLAARTMLPALIAALDEPVG